MQDNLENIVNHRVSIVAVLMKRQIFKILSKKELKVTPDQWVVLYYLWQHNGLSIGEIAKQSKKDFANVTRIVDKLIKMEYLTKKRDKNDSRKSNVFLQPKGNAIKEDIQNCWKEASDIALKGISKIEQEQLMNILTKIENNILIDLE
ncbi:MULTISPECIES: MarR family winged helix-turn-helix transcriptional regulator [unclassified Carboxylicivirga]|uniref:MarR family winged helix-turn-helix transcriptional regulator n=1 Tax=Carboxylicivirga TaxID=1628153 RepID=UPI003D354418